MNTRFNPLDRGNLYQIQSAAEFAKATLKKEFQSPRSGKFVSNITSIEARGFQLEGFNPLDQGNLYLI